MDWGLTTVILAVAFLVGHLAMDFRSLRDKVRSLRHDEGGHHIGSVPIICERCHALIRGKRELRHEIIWTVAAVAVLIGHIILDFVQKGA